jgi:hypothetical protein
MKIVSRKIVILPCVLGSLAFGAGAGWAYAVSSGAVPTHTNGRITGCYDSTGALRVITAGSTCGTDKPLSWVGRIQSAVVFGNGTLLSNSVGVSKVTHTPGSGIYYVYFRYSRAGACPQVASLNDAGSPGMIRAYGGVVAGNVVEVQTEDTAGASADRGFQVILAC